MSNGQSPFIARIQQAEQSFSNNLRLKREELRQLRREHHIGLIADRLVRAAKQAGRAAPADPEAAAADVLEKSASSSRSRGPSGTRSAEENRMVAHARVSWHNLLKKAGAASPDPRGGAWNRTSREQRSVAHKIAALRRGDLDPAHGAQVLRQHVMQELKALAALGVEVRRKSPSAVSPEMAAFITEISEVAKRIART